MRVKINLYPFALFALIALAGYTAGFFGAAIVASLAILHDVNRNNYINLFILLVLIFFFADLITPASSFFDSLRFVVLGFCLYLTIKYTKINQNIAWAILPFSLIALFFSILNSPIPVEASIRACAYLLLALAIFGIIKELFRVYTTEFCNNLILLFFLFYTVPLLLYFTPLREIFQIAGRYTGFMGNPNGLGLLSIMIIPLIDYTFNIVDKKFFNFNKRHFYALKSIILISVILTGSRNALFSIIIYELFKIGFKNVLSSILTVIGLSFSYFAVFTIDWVSILSSIGLNEFFRVDTLESGSGRTDVWEVVWEEIKKSPFIGKGILYDGYFIDQYRRSMTGVIPRAWYGVWNSYLSLWINVGLIGLLAYFYFIFKLYMQSSIKRLATPFLIATLFSGIAESWMAASLNAFTPLFFLYFALQSVPLEEIELKKTYSESSHSL